MGWAAVAQIAGQVADSWISSSSAHNANRTNIEMAREQRKWEENMANTAMQRKVEDLRKSGLNPVLAASGPGAATPSVSVPTIQPTFNAQNSKFGEAAMNAAVLMNLQAQTANSAAQARITNVEADIREKTSNAELENRLKKHVEEYDIHSAKRQIAQNMVTTSAAEAKRQEETVDSLIATAKQQAKEGALNLAALERIAAAGGIEATKLQWVLQIIKDLFIAGSRK